MYEGVSRFGTENAYGIVQDIKDHGSHKEVICEDKTYEGKTVIIATGSWMIFCARNSSLRWTMTTSEANCVK